MTIERHFLNALLDAQSTDRVNVLQVLHHLIFIRANDNLAITAHQKRVAQATGINRIDDFDQAVQAQVTSHHTQQLTAFFNGHGDGHNQASDSCHIRRCQHGLTGAYSLLVPGALAGVITCRHGRVRALSKHAIGLPDVGELKVGGECRLINQAREISLAALLRNILCQALQHQNAATKPVLNAAGCQVASLLHRGLDVLLDSVALQIVVVQRE